MIEEKTNHMKESDVRKTELMKEIEERTKMLMEIEKQNQNLQEQVASQPYTKNQIKIFYDDIKVLEDKKKLKESEKATALKQVDELDSNIIEGRKKLDNVIHLKNIELRKYAALCSELEELEVPDVITPTIISKLNETITKKIAQLTDEQSFRQTQLWKMNVEMQQVCL